MTSSDESAGRTQQQEEWDYDPSDIGGSRVTTPIDTVSGKHQFQYLKNHDWVVKATKSTIECKDCRQKMDAVDKRFDGGWVWRFECPVCRRATFFGTNMTRDDRATVTGDDIKEEYSESDIMSEESLEHSLEYIIESKLHDMDRVEEEKSGLLKSLKWW